MESSTKKTILIIIASIAGLFLLAALGWFLFISSQFSVYQDDQYKLSIKYPNNWKVMIHPRADVSVVFLRPKDTALDPLQENFNIAVQPVPDNVTTMAAFTAAIKRQMTGVFGTSLKIVEDKQLYWGWREGHEIVFEGPDPDRLVMVNAWVFSHGQAYILTFMGGMDKYAKNRLFVDEMIRSLQLQ